jgi:hypothetical protein
MNQVFRLVLIYIDNRLSIFLENNLISSMWDESIRLYKSKSWSRYIL